MDGGLGDWGLGTREQGMGGKWKMESGWWIAQGVEEAIGRRKAGVEAVRRRSALAVQACGCRKAWWKPSVPAPRLRLRPLVGRKRQ
jgi:hypothetical protein